MITIMITGTAMVPVSTAIITRPIRMPPIATGRASAIRTIWSKSRRCSPICAIPQEIYRHSFETIRREAPVDGLPSDIAGMAVRLIHACGMTDILGDLAFSPDIVQAGRAALAGGAPLLCDTAMTAAGIIRRHLPAANEVLAGTENPATVEAARRIGNTRSAAAVDLWGERLDGARGGHRQCADGALPSDRADRSRRLSAGGDPGLSRRLRRCRRIQGAADRRGARHPLSSPCRAGAAAARWPPPRSMRC